jgi:cytochrome P450 family 144
VGTTFDLNDPKLLFSESVLADPRPLYDQLRREAPVWRIPGQDSYLVSDPTLLREAVGRTSEFSSNLVSLLYRNDEDCPVAFEMAPLGDPIHVLAVADPPLHAAHRKLLQPHLSPEAVGALEEPIRQFADERLDSLLATEGGDIVAGLTNPLPAQVVCRLIGLPADDADRMVQLVWDIGLLLDGVTDGEGMGAAASAALHLIELVQTHLDASLAEPPDSETGLLAVLIKGISDGVINSKDALGILMQLITAGTETTSSLMATTIEALARDQELQDRLRNGPDLIPETLEEVLRNDGPFQFHYRFTTTDTTLGGTSIPAHSRVLLMWAAANRPGDEAGDGIKGTERNSRPPPHFAFGRGLHFCIGAPLARLEARVVIERLLQRTSGVTFDGKQPPLMRPSISLRRHVSLPVHLTPS